MWCNSTLQHKSSGASQHKSSDALQHKSSGASAYGGAYCMATTAVHVTRAVQQARGQYDRHSSMHVHTRVADMHSRKEKILNYMTDKENIYL